MPIFGNAIIGLIGRIAAYFASKIGLRMTVGSIAVASVVALSAGLVAFFNLAIAPMASQMFSTSYGQFIGLAFPPISGTVVAAVTGAYMAGFIYRVKVRTTSILATTTAG